ncbi:MAG: type II secretion system protein E, partial [Proteobacteria bacterium SW_6_67_9]
MAKARVRALPKGTLTLERVMDDLVADGLLAADNKRLLSGIYAGQESSDKHALEIIAERDWADASNPHRKLTLERLTEWLAQRADLPNVRIDPLKIDVASITDVMSYAYAKRFNIVALEVSDDAVTIATAEPYVREWEHELEGILRRKIHRVLANPREIERYLLEFYTLARSVQGAHRDQGQELAPGVQNLEQL